jgi:thioredoxin reductase (NADPH)
LFVEGDPSESLSVVLAGRVAMVEGYGTDEQQVVRVHGPGRFLGELSLLTGQTESFTAVAVEDGEVLVVSVEGLRAVVSGDPAFGDDILRACLVRRTLAIGLVAGFRIVGSRYSQDTRRLRDFAMRNGCHTVSSTWRVTRPRSTCCVSWASGLTRPRSWCGGTGCCVT